MTRERSLALAAFVLAALAAIAGWPSPTRAGQVDVDQLAQMIASEQDHVTAVDLAEWLRDGHAHLRVIDVRAAADFNEYHIPRAENVPLTAISRAGFRHDDVLVLYSDGGAHAAQAWVLLRSLGFTKVFFLRGGLGEWLDDVMSPTIPADASAQEHDAFRSRAELSVFFGGKPVVGPRPPASSTSDRVTAMRRGGC